MHRIELAGLAEEEPVLGHGVVDARARQDEAVVAAEGGDHDGGGHQSAPPTGPNMLAAAAVATRSSRRVLDCGERQHVQVDEVRGDVERRNDQPLPAPATSGRLRRGLRTSPAVKVTLFQASEENSEPTIATPTSRTLVETPAGVAPETGEVAGHRRADCGPPETQTRPAPAARPILAKVKTFCTTAPVRMPRVFSSGEKHNHRDGQQLLRGQPELAAAHQVVLRRDPREEDAGVLGESHRHGGDGAGLNHQEQRPAVEEAPERAEGFAQVDVLPAGVRHGGRQFAVAQRGDQRERRGDQPGDHQQAGRIAPGGAISAATMKMPEPIIEPITRVVASTSPRPLTKPFLSRVVAILPSVPAEIEAVAGSGSRPAITARESAPALSTSSALAMVMPPIATSGFSHQRAAAAHFDARHGIGIALGDGGEHRAQRHVIHRLGRGRAELLHVMAGEADVARRPHQAAGIAGSQVVLSHVQAGFEEHGDIRSIVDDERDPRLAAQAGDFARALEESRPQWPLWRNWRIPAPPSRKAAAAAGRRRPRASTASLSRMG